MLRISSRRQRSLKSSAEFAGLGVHTGEEVVMRFNPAPEGTGVIFKRTDLPSQPCIPATVPYVCDTQRSTSIGIGDVRVHTIEHVMAALRAYNIDNIVIEVSNMEPPIGNGGSDHFVDMIEACGVKEQESATPLIKIEKPIYWSEKDIHLVALPYEGYRVSYTLSYPNSKTILRSQYYSAEITSETFRKEIAPCRTFSLYEEVSMLMDRGLIKGGSLDNAIVVKDDVVFSREGLRFPEEMARHKILDLVGDLSLIGVPFEAHIIAIRSGHATNHQLAKTIYQYFMKDKNHA